MTTLLVLAASYLLGGLPFGYLLTRLAGRGDIREMGSGNPGATNVLREVGTGWGTAVLLLDAAKGAGAVYLAAVLAGHTQKGLPAFSIYGHEVQDSDDASIKPDVAEKLLQFARAGLAVATMRGKSYLSIGGTSMGIAGSIVDQSLFENYLGMRVEAIDMSEVARRVNEGIYEYDPFQVLDQEGVGELVKENYRQAVAAPGHGRRPAELHALVLVGIEVHLPQPADPRMVVEHGRAAMRAVRRIDFQPDPHLQQLAKGQEDDASKTLTQSTFSLDRGKRQTEDAPPEEDDDKDDGGDDK